MTLATQVSLTARIARKPPSFRVTYSYPQAMSVGPESRAALYHFAQTEQRLKIDAQHPLEVTASDNPPTPPLRTLPTH